MDSALLSEESVGPAFSVDGMLQAREKTRKAINDIALLIEPGMVEEDAVQIAKNVLIQSGLNLSWHPTRVRFGRNTMKAMKQPSEPGIILQADDIFFIDIAPRFDLWEGDGGASFIVGANDLYARCARDAETLFHEVRAVWRKNQISGQKLYEFAEATASKMGWKLNFDLPGHRVSDFPHAAIHTGSLADLEFTPSELRWILEIHIRHPEHQFGAFFEDMLLEDDSYYSR
jgi:methionyl aminopeptidase